ncbi:MAG: hypothetical protein RMJ84_09345 [Sandaracinaceae bacterium]|nr:hypothetical protein [Sandaracinaceae bacterium]
MKVSVSAPGKLFVSGEYGVLMGAKALVVAVDRRLFLHMALDKEALPSIKKGPLFPELEAAIRLARSRWNLEGGLTIDVDNRSFLIGETKIGLGSSAALASASAWGLAFLAGASRETQPDPVLELALEAHRETSPLGSGADVVASYLGGWVVVRRTAHGMEIKKTEAQKPWPWCVVFSGSSARTREFLKDFWRWTQKDPRSSWARLKDIECASNAFIDAFEKGALFEAIHALRAHHEALRALGEFSEIPIVTEALHAIAKQAEAFGGAAKPSGAGGGDVGIALLPSKEALSAFKSAVGQLGHVVVELSLGAPGVRREE